MKKLIAGALFLALAALAAATAGAAEPGHTPISDCDYWACPNW